MKYLILIATIFAVLTTRASDLKIEVGSTNSKFNYFQIPNDDAERVDLPDETGTSFRLSGNIDITDSTHLYFLYAPLTVEYTTQRDSGFEFDGTDFAASTDTEVSYRFNSYRIGYMWSFGSDTFKYWIGPVGKVRDAELKVTQGEISKAFDNVGFVPLLGLGFEVAPTKSTSLYFHLDGAAASQGSAYDGNVELRIKLGDRSSIAPGYRVLGGGADNDKLKNFAQFETAYLGLLYLL